MSALHTCTKKYGHDLGLSAIFRQWRAKSHCAQLHGYALGFRFEFGCEELDENGWVLDFGSLKPLKQKLVDTFDHKLLVAGDDPALALFGELDHSGLANMLTLPGGVGCEAFAKLAFGFARDQLALPSLIDRGVRVLSCECMEHEANSATYYTPPVLYTPRKTGADR